MNDVVTKKPEGHSILFKSKKVKAVGHIGIMLCSKPIDILDSNHCVGYYWTRPHRNSRGVSSIRVCYTIKYTLLKLINDFTGVSIVI